MLLRISEIYVPIPIPGVGRQFLQGDTAGVVARVPRREPSGIQPTTNTDKEVGWSRHRCAHEDAIGRVCGDMGDQARDRGHVHVVKDDHSPHIEHLIDLKEIHQRVIKCVEAVDYGDLDPGFGLKQLGEHEFGRRFEEVDKSTVTRALDIYQANPCKL